MIKQSCPQRVNISYTSRPLYKKVPETGIPAPSHLIFPITPSTMSYSFTQRTGCPSDLLLYHNVWPLSSKK